jgi:SAM-dependent methyltransferase
MGFTDRPPRLPAYRRYWDQLRIARYLFAAEQIDGGVVLDAGCGVGYGSDLLRDHADVVHGIDMSAREIEIANRSYARPGLEYKAASIIDTGFPSGHFDAVACFEVIEHIDDQEGALAEFKRILKRDGVLVCSTPNKEFTLGFDQHEEEFLPEEFFDFMKKGFRHVGRYAQFITQTDREMDLARGDGSQREFYTRLENAVLSRLFRLLPNGKRRKESLDQWRKRDFYHPGDHFRRVAADLDDYYRVHPLEEESSRPAANDYLRFMIAACTNAER